MSSTFMCASLISKYRWIVQAKLFRKKIPRLAKVSKICIRSILWLLIKR